MSTSLDTFLKSKNPSIFLLNTKEDEDGLSLVKERVKYLKMDAFIKILDEKNLSMEINERSLFKENKIIIFPQAEKLKSSFIKEIQVLKVSDPLIFIGAGMRIAHPLYQWMQEAHSFLDLALETKGAREKRALSAISDMAKAFGKKIAQQNAAYLLNLIGDDLELLYQEIQKISCYVGEREEIVLTDIKALSTNSKEESIWKLMDALYEKNAMQALYIGKKMLRNGVSFFLILRSLRSSFQTELQVANMLSLGDGAITSVFPYMRGKILEQHKNTASRLGVSHLKNALLTIDKTDLLLKNGIDDQELLLELTVINLC
ncbi:MAG: hypothetical protein P4L16_04475 [Chlamydiales bacterium]|nr:hypothetical protein [Chlamydiales bacterium]